MSTYGTLTNYAAGDIIPESWTDQVAANFAASPISQVSAEEQIGYSTGVNAMTVGAMPMGFGGRLTMAAGSAVVPTDGTAGTALYLTPYGQFGGFCTLYNGSQYVPYKFTELTLGTAGMTASKPHDIFLDYNGGSPVLSQLVWTDTTTRATALAIQDGREVLTGALDWNYIGTVHLDAAGTFNDSELLRFIWNRYNQVPKICRVYDATEHAWETGTWRYYNNDSANKIQFVLGLVEQGLQTWMMVDDTRNGLKLGIDLDAATAGDAAYGLFRNDDTPVASGGSNGRVAASELVPGYHYLSMIEIGDTSADIDIGSIGCEIMM